MSRNERKGKAWIASALMCGLVATTSCTRRIYVPVESVSVDTVYVTDRRVDSVVSHDSVYMAQRGDTVYKEVYRLRRRVSLHRDTVREICRDTIRIPVSGEVEAGGIGTKRATRSKISKTVGRVSYSVLAILLAASVWYAVVSLRRRVR